MTFPDYRVTKLVSGIDLKGFDCGEPSYNQWLSEHAATAVTSGSSMVYLLLERSRPECSERVVGYYAICPTMIIRDDMPKSVQRGTLHRADNTGLVGWYSRHGFKDTGSPDLRLYLKVATARKYLQSSYIPRAATVNP